MGPPIVAWGALARNGAAKQFSNTNGLSLLFAKAAIDT